jgi:hypothetical protein
MKINKAIIKKIADKLNASIGVEDLEIKDLGGLYLIFKTRTNFGSTELGEVQEIIEKHGFEYMGFLNVFAEDAYSLRVYINIKEIKGDYDE